MIRKMILIDEEKCNGCGLCATACHEGAIAMVNGKATLIKDDYCDGLGACLPHCPTGALTLEEREAPAFDAEAVAQRQAQLKAEAAGSGCGGGCPGSAARSLAAKSGGPAPLPGVTAKSALAQWPVQLRLAAPGNAFFDNAHLLIAADCSAYAYNNFHADFIQGRITLIACPKLDPATIEEKLLAILTGSTRLPAGTPRIASITLTRMEVPCCGGLEQAVNAAVAACGYPVPVQVAVISAEGEIIATR